MAPRILVLCGAALLVGCGGSSQHDLAHDGGDAAVAIHLGDDAVDQRASEDAPAPMDTAEAKSSEPEIGDGSGGDQTGDQIEDAQPDAQDGAVCGTLVNTASPISATLVTSIPTTSVGGALTDGTYELVAAEETLSSSPAKFWRTFQIADGGTTFQWVVQDVGLPPDHHFAGGLMVMGTSLVFMDKCNSTQLNSYPYDAQGTTLNLYFLFGGGGRLFHYRARTSP